MKGDGLLGSGTETWGCTGMVVVVLVCTGYMIGAPDVT